ncbi:MAG: hydrogenase [Deltaproteobacteria bacterium]|nr:hydrogenase [Deltaproteobacteria bacterium]MCW5803862.1 hydrogenase [Deltaproteobacteria bacterium]
MSNGEARPLAHVPRHDVASFRRLVAHAPATGRRVSALFACAIDERPSLLAVLADDGGGALELARTTVDGAAYPAITPDNPEVHLFEREIAEQTSLVPEGHPWMKPVRFPPGRGEIGVAPFYRIEGGEVHEVAVGPVHAGVIEPGHFRFQCYGETILHLEISLGYQHRGIERAFLGGPHKRSAVLAETLAGDTTIGHASAYCQTVEALAGAVVPPRALALRACALELERVANHVGDLGALSGDIGFLPAAAFHGRLRGDYLNLTAELCGSRFGRGLVRPGGVRFDVAREVAGRIVERLAAALRDTEDTAHLMWDTASVQARFEETGHVPTDVARQLGLVGVAARASNLHRDVRSTHPHGYYRFVHVPASTLPQGDVFARAYLRFLEVRRSVELLRRELPILPEGPIRGEVPELRPEHVAVSLVEGWRGEICHVALTDARGRFATYKVVDPSFHNWTGLAYACRGQQVSDFPLCNKSFNLSYCGHDL